LNEVKYQYYGCIERTKFQLEESKTTLAANNPLTCR
jgi:hypothetical protein